MFFVDVIFCLLSIPHNTFYTYSSSSKTSHLSSTTIFSIIHYDSFFNYSSSYLQIEKHLKTMCILLLYPLSILTIQIKAMKYYKPPLYPVNSSKPQIFSYPNHNHIVYYHTKTIFYISSTNKYDFISTPILHTN